MKDLQANLKRPGTPNYAKDIQHSTRVKKTLDLTDFHCTKNIQIYFRYILYKKIYLKYLPLCKN